MSRVKGKLIKWDNDKAFGFIARTTGGPHVFIHKTAFSNRERIPAINDIITFSLSKDKQGRVCANDATFSGEKLKKKEAKKPSKFSIYLAIGFILAIAVGFILGHIPMNLLFIYLGASVVAYLAYAIDKSKAQKGRWRTQESTLHLFALVGGWPGAAVAQQVLRHKSKKTEFRIGFWLTVVANCAALCWLLTEKGHGMLQLFA